MDSAMNDTHRSSSRQLHHFFADSDSEYVNNLMGESLEPRSESPKVTFNTAANIQQKLEIITHRFNGFTKELVTEKTKQVQSNELQLENLQKAAGQLEQLVHVLTTAREHQLEKCAKKIEGEVSIWPKEHHEAFHPELKQQSKALKQLNERLESLTRDFHRNHIEMQQYLESKTKSINDKFIHFVQQYNEQKQREFDDHQKTLHRLREFDQIQYESFEQQMKQRESDIVTLKERVAVLKPQRITASDEINVVIQQCLVKSYKALESEEVKRKETIEELFQQIQHYTSRLKSCIV